MRRGVRARVVCVLHRTLSLTHARARARRPPGRPAARSSTVAAHHQEKDARAARVDQTLRYLTLAGYGVLVLMLYGRPVVYLPPAWTTPFGWLLAMPGGPVGSLSVSLWLAICRSVVQRLLHGVAARVTARAADKSVALPELS